MQSIHYNINKMYIIIKFSTIIMKGKRKTYIFKILSYIFFNLIIANVMVLFR